MSAFTFILDDPTTGQPSIYTADLKKVDPGVLPKGLAGPFKYVFQIDTGEGPKNFQGTVLMNDNELHVAFEEYPILVKLTTEWTVAGETTRILEFGQKGEDKILGLKASLFGKTHIWLHVNEGYITGGTYCTKAGRPGVLPFYNFHNHGEVCMGNTPRGSNPLVGLNNFLAAYTTPHTTYEDKSLKFKPNKEMTQIVCDKVPKCADFDYPIDRRIFAGKTIATIHP